MNTFDHTAPKSIAVMDNCSIHHVPSVKQLFNDLGIFFFYHLTVLTIIPEELFSYVKHYLKEHDQLLLTVSDPH